MLTEGILSRMFAEHSIPLSFPTHRLGGLVVTTSSSSAEMLGLLQENLPSDCCERSTSNCLSRSVPEIH